MITEEHIAGVSALNWYHLPISMFAGRADFDVTTGRLRNQRCFQGVYCMYRSLHHKLRVAMSNSLSFFYVNVPVSTQSYDDRVLKAILRLRIAATSMAEYVSSWCGHVFKSHSQPFLLTYLEVDLSI